jgi:hypothetical protein
MYSNFKKSFKLLLFITTFLLFCFPLNVVAQDSQVEFETIEDAVEPSDEDDIEVTDIMDKYLEDKDWDQGINKKKDGTEFFISIGFQEILSPYKSKSFIDARQRAFEMAMAKAKRKMVEHLETEIETSMQIEMNSPSDLREEARLAEINSEVLAINELKNAAGAAKSDIQNKGDEFGSEFVKQAASGADRLYRDKLDKELRAKGIDPDKPVDAQLLKKTFEQSFQKSTKALAQSRLQGITAYATFEHLPADKKKGTIGVIALWSKKLHAMALAVTKGGILIPPGTPKKRLKKQIPKSKQALLMTFGVQMKTDENGNLNLVSFCQQGQKTKRSASIASRQASVCAKAQIRTYAGEMLYSASRKDDAESLEVFENEMEVYEDDSSFADKIKTESKKLKISGIANLKTWHTKHPITKQKIRGAIVAWSPESSRVAKNMRSRVNSDEVPAEFSAVNQKQKKSKGTDVSKPKEKPPEPRKTLSGVGSSGSDDF